MGVVALGALSNQERPFKSQMDRTSQQEDN